MIHSRTIGILASLLLLTGCLSNLPGQNPLTKAPESASTPWRPSPEQASHPRGTTGASDFARAPRIPDLAPIYDGELRLPELIDIALRNSPETRETWASTRASAAVYGEAQAPYYPSIDLGASVFVERTELSGGRDFFEQFNYSPIAELSYLLLDFGGRSAHAEAAWQALVASNWQHNQRMQDVVLRVATSYHMLQGRLATLNRCRSQSGGGTDHREVGRQEERSRSRYQNRCPSGTGTPSSTLPGSCGSPRRC